MDRETTLLAKVTGFIILVMLMVVIMRQPEEPTTINLTAEDCAKAKCYSGALP